MFSLIITIISIALVVALVAATMYHGGDVLTQGRVEADAAGVVAGAQQITGAAAMHLALAGKAAADVNALVTAKYLSSVPSIEGTWGALGANSLTATNLSDAVCDSLAADGSDTYGCVKGATDAENTFSFKY